MEMERLLQLFPAKPPAWVRYGISVMLVGFAFALRLAVQDRTGPYTLYLFVPPIVLSALFFDRGSGFLSLALSAVLSAALLDWSTTAALHFGVLATFVAIGVLLVFVGEGFHTALERAVQAERAKDLLLAELRHRVKNEFAMILSLIGLQIRQAVQDPQTALEGIARRVRVIANIHDQLQGNPESSQVDLSVYLTRLCRSLEDSVRDLRPIAVMVAAEPLSIAADKALSIGLIINELVTNALKHAFEHQTIARVHVRVVRSDDQIELSVSDNGKGCPDEIKEGLGTRLLALLVEQLGGTIARNQLSPGCRISVSIPNPS